MNETIIVIKSRRSIMRFKMEQTPDLVLQGILECALLAPNARNQQKWHFTVIQNKDVLNRMIDIMKENMINSGIEFLVERAKSPDFNPFGKSSANNLDHGGKTARFR